MTSVDRPSRGFTPLLAAVAMLSMATATVRLIAESWIKARPESTRAPVATAPEATSPPTTHELASRAATAITTETDLASRAAAAAKLEVERSFGISNAKVVESVVARRVGGGSSVDDGVKRPRYQAEVAVEIPRGLGLPIRRHYFLTLQYVGAGKWQAERIEFVTRY
jgi:hypothetical protein